MRAKKFFFLVLSVVILVACDKDEISEFQKPELIRFNSGVNNFTRALSTFGPIDINALKFSTDGFAVSTNGLGTEMNNLIVKYNVNQWTYAGDYFWPLDPNQYVIFAAYAPAGTTNVTLTSAGLTASSFVPATTITNQIDLIYAPPTIYNRAGAGTDGVNLQFNHILTQVIFSITTDLPSSYNPKIVTATLSLPKGKGSFNGTTWTTTTYSRTYTIFSNKSIVSTPLLSSPLFMIPQTLPSGTNLSITFSANGKQTTISRDLSQLSSVKSWQLGYRVTYNVFLRKASLGLSSLPMDIETIEIEGFE